MTTNTWGEDPSGEWKLSIGFKNEKNTQKGLLFS